MASEKRVALVTGGGRGLGRGISLALAQDGHQIAILYRRDEDSARDTEQAIREAGGTGRVYAGSVDDFPAMEALVKEIAAEMGPIGILVNNAGIASRGRAVADTEVAEIERVMRVHAVAPFYLSKLVIPGMRALGRGDIVMISSAITRHFSANGAPYSMGKAAVEALTMTLAKEERRNNIRVNVVASPLLDTEMGIRLAKAAFGVKENIHELDGHGPLERIPMPADVAEVVRFLVSERNTIVSGQKIYADSGGA